MTVLMCLLRLAMTSEGCQGNRVRLNDSIDVLTQTGNDQ